VCAPYFSFLDDDDEYLPGAVDERLREIGRRPGTDVLVTNGYLYGSLFFDTSRLARVTGDPLEAVIESNWLVSCGAIYRSASVPIDYFDGTTKYLEWTVLAFKLAAAGKCITVIETRTYRVNDSPGSLSESHEYVHAEVSVFQDMLNCQIPAAARRRVRRKLADACHRASDFHRIHADIRRAWAYHIRSLGYLAGWRYIPYTRHLLAGVARSGWALTD
jgi:hypothetical protein